MGWATVLLPLTSSAWWVAGHRRARGAACASSWDSRQRALPRRQMARRVPKAAPAAEQLRLQSRDGREHARRYETVRSAHSHSAPVAVLIVAVPGHAPRSDAWRGASIPLQTPTDDNINPVMTSRCAAPAAPRWPNTVITHRPYPPFRLRAHAFSSSHVRTAFVCCR